ncbi:hypothetical protein FFT09_21675 [Saccharomonospora piscinae]|uniref:hypothetical protein n=1 Tax=Saccharomonospora piscinae TaxID=687388 RepID=UPI00110756EA|nr:hypothetical protein [Saccharomonospora piscinae]TLW89597.1 hypothetical protein FFT09_21675 [Saccharomonospora piscinae]
MKAARRLPRWLIVAVVVGVAAFLWIFTPWVTAGERAATAAGGLEDSSVHVDPGAPGLVDPQRAREVIGDRAIVVAIFDETPLDEYADETVPRLALCRDVAELVPTNLVVVFATEPEREYGSSYCEGPAFPDPTETDDDAAGFALSVVAAAEQSWQYRASDTDLTPELEEYVLTFDAEAAEAYGELPRRGPVDSVTDVSQLVLAFLGIVSATIAVFLLLRGLALVSFRRKVTAPKEAELGARLNRVADRVLHPEGEPNAEAAKEYVLAMRELGEPGGTARLDRVRRRLDRIEELL